MNNEREQIREFVDAVRGVLRFSPLYSKGRHADQTDEQRFALRTRFYVEREGSSSVATGPLYEAVG